MRCRKVSRGSAPNPAATTAAPERGPTTVSANGPTDIRCHNRCRSYSYLVASRCDNEPILSHCHTGTPSGGICDGLPVKTIVALLIEFLSRLLRRMSTGQLAGGLIIKNEAAVSSGTRVVLGIVRGREGRKADMVCLRPEQQGFSPPERSETVSGGEQPTLGGRRVKRKRMTSKSLRLLGHPL